MTVFRWLACCLSHWVYGDHPPRHPDVVVSFEELSRVDE